MTGLVTHGIRKKYAELVESGYIQPYKLSNGFLHTGHAVKCWFCGGTAVKRSGSIFSDSSIEEATCEECGKRLSFHEYGNYEYNFLEVYPSKWVKLETGSVINTIAAPKNTYYVIREGYLFNYPKHQQSHMTLQYVKVGKILKEAETLKELKL